MLKDISDFITLHPYFSIFLVIIIFLIIDSIGSSISTIFISKNLQNRVKILEDKKEQLKNKEDILFDSTTKLVNKIALLKTKQKEEDNN